MYYVYVDYTCEQVPRPFYVGKGSLQRVCNLRRNKKHSNVSTKYGIDRRVVLQTEDEQFAFDEETRLISEHRTCALSDRAVDIACNYTFGGEGASGLHRCAIRIVRGDQIFDYDSISAAAEALGVAQEIVGRVLRGRRKSSMIDGCTLIRLGAAQRSRKPSTKVINSRSIVAVDSSNVEQEFESIVDAASKLGVSRNTVHRALNTDVRVQGFLLRTTAAQKSQPKASESTRKTISESLKGRKFSQTTRDKLSKARSKIVVKRDVAGNVVQKFASVIEARIHLGVSKSTMLNIIHLKRVYKEHTWTYES